MVFLTGGKSNLILLERHIGRYGRPPLQNSADGGFASQANLTGARAAQVKDVVFAKKRGLSVMEMAKSTWMSE